jgi:hypothetical protein
MIGRSDIELIAQSRTKANYKEISSEEQGAYEKVHVELGRLAEVSVEALGGKAEFNSKLTASFTPKAGVMGGLPKDLWFAAFNRRNADAFVAMPQVFAIVSARGIEVGLAAAIHPSDFSRREFKDRVRKAAPRIFSLFPEPGSPTAMKLAESIRASGTKWFYQKKARLDPSDQQLASLDARLRFLKSEEGANWAGGSISHYISAADLDDPALNLDDVVRETAQLFSPVLHDVVSTTSVSPIEEPPEKPPRPDVVRPAIEDFFLRYATIRASTPCGRVPELWAIMDRMQSGLTQSPPILANPHVRVTWSLGSGSWASVPWIALMDDRETRSTQRGTYVAFLVRQDMSGVYVTSTKGRQTSSTNSAVPRQRDAHGPRIRSRRRRREAAWRRSRRSIDRPGARGLCRTVNERDPPGRGP